MRQLVVIDLNHTALVCGLVRIIQRRRTNQPSHRSRDGSFRPHDPTTAYLSAEPTHLRSHTLFVRGGRRLLITGA